MSSTTANTRPILEELELHESGQHRWQTAAKAPMQVPAKVFTDAGGVDDLLTELHGQEWSALKQLVNVTTLPGILRNAIAMADVHPGYGYPIGGVGAFDPETGVVSMAGVGFDINCGMRTLRTPLMTTDISGREQEILDRLWEDIPAGLGGEGEIRLNQQELDRVLTDGAAEMVRRGYGIDDDLTYIEENGSLAGADPAVVSKKAKQRQRAQVGTLGSGNHFVEVQRVDKIYDDAAAEALGLTPGQIVITLHTGSRALGHQIGTDFIPQLEQASKKYGIQTPDRELASAPITSPEGKRYLAAVQAGGNCAFANRQVLGHLVRLTIARLFDLRPEEVETLYEVCHNTAKFEQHTVDGEPREVLVHRKGATRSFGPGRAEVPERYRHIGQPVIVGGTMGTASYLLHGTSLAMEETFGSALHGAGRAMSRRKANRSWKSPAVRDSLREQGTLVRAHGKRSLAEESPGAYKDVERVVRIMSEAGIVGRVARLRPVVCLKG